MNLLLSLFFQLQTQLPSVPQAVDSLERSNIKSFFAQLKTMTLDQIVDAAVRGLVGAVIRVALAVLIFYIGRWIIRHVIRFFQRLFTRRKVEASLTTFLLSMLRVAMMFLLFIVVISFLGIDTTSFIALFASAGLAVGMALSGTLQNFAGGVLVLLLKPYRVGDYIEAQGQAGTVRAITLFTTQLATPDNKIILLPNGGMSTGIINNYSHQTLRSRLDLRHSLRRRLRPGQGSAYPPLGGRSAGAQRPSVPHRTGFLGRLLGQYYGPGLGQEGRVLERVFRHERKSL